LGKEQERFEIEGEKQRHAMTETEGSSVFIVLRSCVLIAMKQDISPGTVKHPANTVTK
jgi:DNA-binding CsgD family transcriptional regulator